MRAEVRPGIELEYGTFGAADDPPLLLVMGLGGQLIAWDDAFCEKLAAEGFRVIRFDNRDVGLSTRIDTPDLDLQASLMAAFTGAEVEAPYLLSDMADDAFGLLDHLAVESAHLVGVSMGGMIVQTMVVSRPERVRSVSSIMSTTGARGVGQPTPEAMAILLRPVAGSREAYLESAVEGERLLAGDVPFDEARARRRAAAAYDRAYHPVGVGRQLLAILASPDRTGALGAVDVPFLVIHGDRDVLVTPSGGDATAAAVPGAELLTIEGMGHSLPEPVWDRVVAAIVANSRKAG